MTLGQPTNDDARRPPAASSSSESANLCAATDPCSGRRGRLTLIYGCMFSGKTTKLIYLLEQRDPNTVVAVKHAVDTRYRLDSIVSHDQKSFSARVADRADSIPDLLSEQTCLVAIDEGHFFGMALLPVVGRLLDLGMDLALTTLDHDSWGRPFSCFLALQECADACETGSVPCARCGATAVRTQRLTPIVDGKMVGGPEAYEPRCVECWQPPPVK